MRIQWQIESSIWWNNIKEEQVDELNKLLKDICKYNAKIGEQQRPNKLSIDDIERSTIGYHKRIINN